MKDTISRQAAIDALQNCHKHCVDPMDSYHIDIQDAEYQLSKVPSAQPEIIRCKDCKNYWDSADLCCLTQCDAYEDDFCSRAERKQDG